MAEALAKAEIGLASRVRQTTVSSSWLKEEDFRLDAATYAQEAAEVLRTLKSFSLGTERLDALTGRIYHPTENQPRSNFKRIWTDERYGVPFLTGRQLLFFRPDSDKFISRRTPKLSELIVPQGTILLSRSGSTGYPTLVGQWLERFAVTDDAIRIFPGSGPTGFVYAFLASRFAQALITKSEYGKVVSHIEAKHIASLPVPNLSADFKKSVHDKITGATSLRDAANELLTEATRRLHEVLGVSPFDDSDIEYIGDATKPRSFSISSSEFGARLDATNHVPLARSAIHKLSQGRFKLIALGELIGRANIYMPPRAARVYVEEEHGIPLLQGSQMPLIRPYGLKYISRTKTPALDRWIIHTGTVLITRSGTIGRVGLCSESQDGWAASEHMLRILSTETDTGFLAAFLSDPFGQHQVMAKIYGGVVDELTDDDLANVMIPDVPHSAQTTVGDLVRNAYRLRDESNELELDAIADVENAITNRDSFEENRDVEIASKRIADIQTARGRLIHGSELRDRLRHMKT